MKTFSIYILLILAGISLGPEAADRVVPDGSHLLSLTASVRAKQYRRTEAVPLVIEAKNLTSKSIVFHHHGRENSIFAFEVTDDHGQEMPDTLYAEHSVGDVVTGYIKAGESKKYTIFLNTIKDMTEPGDYQAIVRFRFIASSEHRQIFDASAKPVKIRIVELPE